MRISGLLLLVFLAAATGAGAKTLAGKLETHRDAAMLARQLTGIACDAPLEQPPTGLRPVAPDLGAVNALYDEANIGMALRRQAERVADLLAT